jgi:hypothetical protein
MKKWGGAPDARLERLQYVGVSYGASVPQYVNKALDILADAILRRRKADGDSEHESSRIEPPPPQSKDRRRAKRQNDDPWARIVIAGWLWSAGN